MKVSFDFDGTLTKQEVQDYAKSLINKGIDVFIVTARFNELRKRFYKPNPTNDDLWEVCKKVGIPERNVIFCNMEDKSYYLIDSEVKFHLDDCWVTIKEIEANLDIPVVDVNLSKWKLKCNALINAKP